MLHQSRADRPKRKKSEPPANFRRLPPFPSRNACLAARLRGPKWMLVMVPCPSPADSTDPRVGRQMVSGASWVVAQRLLVRLIGFISTLILARLLVPQDFGLVALATAFTSALDGLLELGFDLNLIQKQSATRERYDTAWTLSVIRGVLVAVVLCAGAAPLAAFYGEPRLLWVLMALAFAYFVMGFQNIGIVEFRLALRFDRECRLLVLTKLISFAVTLALAVVWRDYRALVVGIVVNKCAGFVLSYTMHPYRPRFSLVGAGSFIHFSKWLGMANVLGIINTRLDAMILGKLVGAASLGIYTVAAELSNLATTELIWPIARALFPGYAKIAHDRPALSATFLDAFSLIMLLAAPVTVGIAVMAEPIVRLALGPAWLAAIPIIQILALYGLLDMPTSNVKALFLALGRPDLILWRDIPASVVLIPSLFIGASYWGTTGAAWALVLGAVVSFTFAFGLLRRYLDVGIGDIAARAWRPLVAAIGMAGVVHTAISKLPHPEATPMMIMQTGAEVLLGIVAYVAFMVGLWFVSGRPAGAEAHLLVYGRAQLAARRTGPQTGGSRPETFPVI